MNRCRAFFLRRFLRDSLGQSMVVVALTLAGVMAVCATGVETGHIYYAYQLLVSSTNAAALAGGQQLPDTDAATTYVNKYSSATVQGVAGYNSTPILQNVSVSTSFECLNTVINSLNISCETPTGGSGGNNALQVTQTASVPLWFGGLVGLPKANLRAVSTAAMRGGQNTPWNIAIILDATGSMNNPDYGTQSKLRCNTQEKCAELGIQTLLGLLDPCAVGQTCSSNTGYVDAVSLYVFPNVVQTSASNDYCAGNGSAQAQPYSVPDLPSNLTYNIISFSNDYRSSDSSTGLSTSSDLAKATGYKHSGCSGIQANGSTYYAQVITQAQSDLKNQQTDAKNGSQNAIILLSDGDATAGEQGWLQASSSNSLNGVPGNNPTSYAYPSINGECGQAVLAAQAAADAGTKVITIGYGTETSGSCLSDKTYSATVTTNGGSWGPGDQACQAMAAMASAPEYFFSDGAHGCKATTPDNANLTTLTDIFTKVWSFFTNARLIPNGTT